ncbi:hypothetical protein E8E11_001535 [Didymella keratinophila]|nr:hypothetical protein E8E11_001535 [Didymella keratinophila]
MVDKKMSVTGGVGTIEQWEGFGIDYFPPQSTDEGGCYNETCDLDGKALTYVNQLGSSEADKSGREDWFWCACCPPNYSRLFGSLGSLGGYLWHFGHQENSACINVHFYTSARVAFAAEEGPIEIQQSCNWPWNGSITFTLANPNQVPTTIRLRIPAWSNDTYTVDPPLSPSKDHPFEKGYPELSPEYLCSNPRFTLTISGFEPRWVEPHPYTSSNTVFLARGPVIYCAEDAHNPWETNHFKDLVVKLGSCVAEEVRTWEPTGETYIALRSRAWTRRVKA